MSNSPINPKERQYERSGCAKTAEGTGADEGHQATAARERRPFPLVAVVAAILLLAAIVVACLALSNGSSAVTGEGGVGSEFSKDAPLRTVLFVGYDQEENSGSPGQLGQCDTLLLGVIDPGKEKLAVIAIPRDTIAEIDRSLVNEELLPTKEQICVAFNFGRNLEEGVQSTVKSVSALLGGVPIDNYVALNLSGIAPLNDAVGGVELVPIESITETDAIPPTDIVEGESRLLLGDEARWYLQYRNVADDESSLRRLDRQVQYAKAYAGKLAETLSEGGIEAALSLYSAASGCMTTDLEASDLLSVASMLKDGMDNVEFVTLPGEMSIKNGLAEYRLDDEKVKAIVKDVLHGE